MLYSLVIKSSIVTTKKIAVIIKKRKISIPTDLTKNRKGVNNKIRKISNKIPILRFYKMIKHHL